MITYLIAFLAALLASLAVTPWVRDLARKLGWVDNPDEVRKLHRSPVPRIGGLAIFLAFLASVSVVYLLPGEASSSLRDNLTRACTIVGLSGLMMLVGFCDDVKNLSPWRKFAAQMPIALAAWYFGLRIMGSWSTHGGIFGLGVLSLPITLIWIVGITNAFNLIDGIDGLSAGAALFAMFSMIVVAAFDHHWLSVILLSSLAGSTLGFLRLNFTPASIFLGDSGSLLLGFMLAVLGIESSQKSSTAFAIAVPIVAFGLPVLDTAIAILRRFLSGKPIFRGDRRHIHHVLIGRGLKPRNVVILLYGVCGLFGLFSLLFMNPSGRTMGLSLAILGVCVWFGIQQLHYPELREFNGYIGRGIRHQRELIAGNVVIGKMIDGFRSARNLAELLEGLSTVLKELEFSRAEMRLPGLNENKVVLHIKGWKTVTDGRMYCLYQWFSPNSVPIEKRSGKDGQASPSDRVSLGNDFRLEFVFKVARQATRGASAQDAEETRCNDIGRLTFYHPMTSSFPVSAICLLSRNIWSDFANAVGRIMAQQYAGLANRSAGGPEIPEVEAKHA